MIFGIITKGGATEFVDAMSWYDAREWARGRYGEALADVLAHSDGGEQNVVDAIVVPRAVSTAHERHVEHTESTEVAAYERGYAKGFTDAEASHVAAHVELSVAAVRT